MSIFASKAAFMQLGVEQVAPSTAHMYQDCYICKHPLDIKINTATTDAHHQALRIGVCGHLHGKECLSAWLNVGNSCPTCKRLLFEESGHTITQTDISFVLINLRSLGSEKRIMSAIARVMGKQDLDLAQLRRNHKADMESVKAREVEFGQHDLMDDDEWMESDDEDFDTEAGEDEGMEDGGEDSSNGENEEDEDGGVAIPREDGGPKSGTT